MTKILIGSFTILTLSACVSMTKNVRKQESAGAIGCPPEQIEISEAKPFTWAATCRGKRFYCSATNVEGSMCKEEIPAN